MQRAGVRGFNTGGTFFEDSVPVPLPRRNRRRREVADADVDDLAARLAASLGHNGGTSRGAAEGPAARAQRRRRDREYEDQRRRDRSGRVRPDPRQEPRRPGSVA